MMPRTKYCCLLPKPSGWNKGDRSSSSGRGHHDHHEDDSKDDVPRLDDTQLSFSDGELDEDVMDSRQQKGGGANRQNRGDRSYQTGDSDFEAVEWMRHRSAESSASSGMRILSEQAQKEWTRRGRTNHVVDRSRQGPPDSTAAKTAPNTAGNIQQPPPRTTTTGAAREESIEVDDLSLFGIRILDQRNSSGHTATTSSGGGSSSGMSFDPWRNSFLVDPRGEVSAVEIPQLLFPASSPPQRQDNAILPAESRRQRENRSPGSARPSSYAASPASPEKSLAQTNASMLSDAENELDAIIQSFSSSRSGETRRHTNLRPRHEEQSVPSKPQGRGLRTKEYRSTATTSDIGRVSSDAMEAGGAAIASRWSPRRPMGNASSRSPRAPAAAGSKIKSSTTKPNPNSADVPSRYVMEALPRRSQSPKSPGRHRDASRSKSPHQRKLQDLRSLDPILPAALAADDALSNVPSDVDPATTQRYLRACRLLKSALIERDTSLLPQERAFLNRLLEEPGGSHGGGGPVDLDEQASAIETASFTLMSDPLFQVESVNSSTFAEFEDVRGKRADRRGPHSRTQEEAESTRRRRGGDVQHPPSQNTSSPSTPPLVVVDERHHDKDSDEAAKAKAAAVAVARFDGKDYPFYILGVTPDFKVGALTPTLMESLRGFFPAGASEENFFLKFSLQRDGPSLPTLLSRVRTSRLTVIAVETTDGHVFGAFCSAPWRTQAGWFGNDDSFLWRLKRPRFHERSKSRNFDHDCEIEVYPVFRNTRIQYCTSQTLAVGGGEWGKDSSGACPYPSEPTGIGFMIDGDLMGGETNSCSTFCNPRLGQRVISKGGSEFDVRCLEVWTVTPAVTIDDAENLEMHRHFVR